MSQETCTDCLPPAQGASATPQPAAAPTASSSAALDPILDPSTFSPPYVQQNEFPRVEIEFCDRCRWLHRATWTMTELFLTFPPLSTTSPEGVVTSTGLKSINLLPRSAPETGGRFRVWLYRERSIEEEYEQNCPDNWGSAELVWDRKVEGGFPELKDLKQRIRDLIAPRHDLGHSDKNAFGVKPDRSEKAVEAKVEEKKEEKEPAPEVDDYTPRFKC